MSTRYMPGQLNQYSSTASTPNNLFIVLSTEHYYVKTLRLDSYVHRETKEKKWCLAFGQFIIDIEGTRYETHTLVKNV